MQFPEKILAEYRKSALLIQTVKQEFLQILSFQSVDEGLKDQLRHDLVEMAKAIGNHFNKIRFADINRYNMDEYIKLEWVFLRSVKKSMEHFRKGLKRAAPVALKKNASLSTPQLDRDILSKSIYGMRVMEKDSLDRLNCFEEALKPAAKPKKEPQKKQKKDKSGGVVLEEQEIQRELDALKRRAAEKRGLEGELPEIFFKVQKNLEKLMTGSTRKHALDQLPAFLNPQELYIQCFGDYNYLYFYRKGNLTLKLDLALIQKEPDGGLRIGERLRAVSEAGVDRLDASILLPEAGAAILPEQVAGTLDSLLEGLGLKDLVQTSRVLFEEQRSQEKEREERGSKDTYRTVSEALDLLLGE